MLQQMVTAADINTLFQEKCRRFTTGQSCPDAAAFVKRWLLQEHNIITEPARTAWVVTSVPPLRRLDGDVPHHSFKVCTKVYKLSPSCIWVEDVMPDQQLLVRYGAQHVVLPVSLDDVPGITLVDLSVMQFQVPPTACLQLYTK